MYVLFLVTTEGFPGRLDGEEFTCNVEDLGLIPGLRRPLGEGKGFHSRIFAWEILWTEEPGGLQSWSCKESDTSDQLLKFIFFTLFNCKTYFKSLLRYFWLLLVVMVKAERK